MEQLIQSAALYGEADGKGHVPVEWLDGALDLLRSCGLHVREYGVVDNPVCPEGMYPFRGDDPQLASAIRTGSLRSLELYCHSRKRRNLLFDWEGVVSIDLSESDIHVGLPATCVLTLDELLRRTYALAKPLASWRYGIGYFRSSRKAPSLYAAGILGGSLYPDPGETEKDRERIGCWYRELLFASRRRHLKGHFRDVYPANLLSAEHVQARLGGGKTLLTSGLGRLTPVDQGLWICPLPATAI